jgi:hypothetical protein
MRRLFFILEIVSYYGRTKTRKMRRGEEKRFRGGYR